MPGFHIIASIAAVVEKSVLTQIASDGSDRVYFSMIAAVARFQDREFLMEPKPIVELHTI